MNLVMTDVSLNKFGIFKDISVILEIIKIFEKTENKQKQFLNK